MYYDYKCDTCDVVTTVKRQMTDPEWVPQHADHGPMRRLYGDHETTIQWDRVSYIEQAYHGKQDVFPGMSTEKVRSIVDSQHRDAIKGRVTRPRRGIVQ